MPPLFLPLPDPLVAISSFTIVNVKLNKTKININRYIDKLEIRKITACNLKKYKNKGQYGFQMDSANMSCGMERNTSHILPTLLNHLYPSDGHSLLTTAFLHAMGTVLFAHILYISN